jgi:hypothetical protein
VVSSSAPFVCANGAVFHVSTDAVRPVGWTSADLAGLSVFAGLAKLVEVKAGSINHAVRVTFKKTQSSYIFPARNAASPGNQAAPVGSAYPPMGLRLRLKAGVSISSYSAPSQVILRAMKEYGLIVADIGNDWFFQGDGDDGWNETAPDGKDTLVNELTADFANVTGADFEVIYSGDPQTLGL